MDYRWTCACCGREFHTLPLDYAVKVPDNWWGVPETDRDRLVHFGPDPNKPDVCIIGVGERERYVRGVIEIPVIDGERSMTFSVWVSVSEASLARILELWDAAEIDPEEPPRFGWLSTTIEGYPRPLGIKCHVHVQPKGRVPLITLEPTNYPLAVEQHNGITLERVKAIAAGSHN